MWQATMEYRGTQYKHYIPRPANLYTKQQNSHKNISKGYETLHIFPSTVSPSTQLLQGINNWWNSLLLDSKLRQNRFSEHHNSVHVTTHMAFLVTRYVIFTTIRSKTIMALIKWELHYHDITTSEKPCAAPSWIPTKQIQFQKSWKYTDDY